MLSKKSGKGNRMVVDDKWNHDWALYSGDRFVTMGTLYEISEYTGISLDALKCIQENGIKHISQIEKL